MSEIHPESPKQHDNDNKTTTKRTPSKRKSTLERVQAESEELIKNMGVIDVETDGRRRTRSSVKGTPTPCTPPPSAKKQKLSMSTTRRGRPKKIENSDKKLEEEEIDNNETPMETEEKNKIVNEIVEVDVQINNISEKESKEEISIGIDEKIPETVKVDCQQEINKNDNIVDETLIKENDCETQIVTKTVPDSKDTKSDNESVNIGKNKENLDLNDSKVIENEKEATIEKCDDKSVTVEKEISDKDLKEKEKEKLSIASLEDVDNEEKKSLSINTSNVKADAIVDDTRKANSPAKEKIVEEIKKDSTSLCEPKIAIDETGSDECMTA